MKIRFKSAFVKTVAFVLMLSLVSPCSAMAATGEEIKPYASNYLTLYNTYICDMGTGEFQIWYEVLGKGTMDEIGVLTIELYQVLSDGSLDWVKTFLYEDHDTMLVYNDYYHFSYVSFYGVPGKEYKAYVCIWAGKNGGGDTRYMWATIVP